ncbi:MAG: hypothetical protein K9L74_04105 [Candidatus Izimaplasma sp.]|nr:hypothetical protein [Candidatus Izimaplasma bacterium]
MNLVDNYLYHVGKFLPLTQREEILKELKSHIYDQVESESDDEIKAILKEMGHPKDVASEYRNNRSMLPKELEPIISLVIKIILIVMPIILLFVNLIEFLVNNSNFNTLDILRYLIYQVPEIISSVLMIVGLIFIVFVLIEKYFQPEIDTSSIPFDPDNLPTIPTKIYHASRLGSLIELIVDSTILYILNVQIGLIAIYFEGTSIPLLNENFNAILPLINISISISIILNIFHFYKNRKTLISKSVELIQHIFIAIILFFMATNNIFNLTLISGYNLEVVPQIIKISLIFAGVAIIIATVIEVIQLLLSLKDRHLKSD